MRRPSPLRALRPPVLFCLSLTTCWGCANDAEQVLVEFLTVKQALVVNQNSNNVSAVDLKSGAVTPNFGGLAIGPTANRVVVRGARAYVVNSGAFPGSTGAGVEVVELANNQVVNTIPFSDGENPWAIAFVSDAKAYVTTLYGNNVTVLDPRVNGAAAILKTIALPVFTGPNGPVPAGPEGIVVAGGYAYTTNTAWDSVGFSYLPGSVSIIDTAADLLVDADADAANGTDTPVFTSRINPQDLDVDGEGRIHVVCTGDYFSQFGVMDAIDPVTWAVASSVPLGGSPGNVSILGGWALVGAGDADSGDLYVVRTDTGQVVHDSTNPLTLMATSGWCTVGKISFGADLEGLKAYAPAGSLGAEARLFELTFDPTAQQARAFDLAPGANMPAAVGLVY